MPSGPVEQQNGMGAFCGVARDFVEVELHHIGDGMGQRQRGPTPRACQMVPNR
jgi:hypothetical protein